ncbi:alpha/beta fold hydrolase [Streptomyces sp. NPDC012461]|uniref:thioesterase II family protein n=1 Tax=Streptomyces sp. NPDC012461 TaxID=3155117 RepID=UPI0034022F03
MTDDWTAGPRAVAADADAVAADAVAAHWTAGTRDPDAEVRMICFAHAGGGSALFLPWRRRLAPRIDVVPVVLPGRERRIQERPHTRMADLVAELVPALQPLLDRPYVLFGHSMGAMVAYEVAQRLRPAPGMVFVSGRRVPGVTGERHLLGDRDLLGVVNGLGGTPSALLDSPDLASLFLPALRADFQLVETYRPAHTPPLDCPLTALTGDADPEVTPAQMARWGDLTAGGFGLHVFPGDHFYLKGLPEALRRTLLDGADRVSRPPATPRRS